MPKVQERKPLLARPQKKNNPGPGSGEGNSSQVTLHSDKGKSPLAMRRGNTKPVGARGGQAAGGTSPKACLAPSHPGPPHPEPAQPQPQPPPPPHNNNHPPRPLLPPHRGGSRGPAPHPRPIPPHPALRGGSCLTAPNRRRATSPALGARRRTETPVLPLRGWRGGGTRGEPPDPTAAASPAPQPRPPHTDSRPRMRAGPRSYTTPPPASSAP